MKRLMNVLKINRCTGSRSEFDVKKLEELVDENGEDFAIFVEGEPFFLCDKGKTERDF